MKDATRLVRFDAAPGDPNAPVAPPIYQTATFAQPSAVAFGKYDYTRSGNPTRALLEEQLARLEGGRRAFAFASGMAALATLTRLLPAGSHVVAGSDLYGGTHRLLTRVLGRYGVTVDFVDATDLDAVAAALTSETRLLLCESPTNPLLRVCDLRALAGLARDRGALFVVDNSLMSPLLQKPLALGADVVVHSGTKFLSGHADVTAGALVVNDEALAEELAFLQNAEGTGLAPFEAWLLVRGMKTLSVRLERQEASARRIAAFLATHPLVTRVHYPGLPGHPGHALHHAQARGAGSVLSFETGSAERSRRVVEATRLHTIAVSFGSVGATISLPCRMSHASIPAGERTLPEDLVRVSVGVEDADDLIGDLAQALAAGVRHVSDSAAVE